MYICIYIYLYTNIHLNIDKLYCMQALQHQNKLLKQLSTALQKQNQCRNQQKDTLIKQLQIMTIDNDQLRVQIQKLKNNNDNCNINSNSNSNNNNSVFEGKINDMQQYIHQLQYDLNNYERQRYQMINDINILKGQNQRLNAASIITNNNNNSNMNNNNNLNNSNTNNNHNQQLLKLKDQQYNQLQLKLNQQLHNTINLQKQFQNKLQELQTQHITILQTKNSQIQKLVQFLQQKQSQINHNIQQINTINLSNRQIKTQLQQIKQQKQNDQKQLKQLYQRQLQAKIIQINQQQQQYINDHYVEKSKMLLEEQYQQITKLKQQHKKYIQLLKQQQQLAINKLQNQISNMNNMDNNNNNKQKIIQQYQLSITHLNRQKQTLKNKLRDRQIQCADLKAQLRTIIQNRKQIIKCADDIKFDQQQNMHLGKIIQKLKSSNQYLENKSKGLEGSLMEFQRERDDFLNQIYQEKNTIIKRLEEQVQELKDKIKNQEKQYQQYQQEIVNKNKQNCDLINIVRELRQENKSIKQNILKLTSNQLSEKSYRNNNSNNSSNGNNGNRILDDNQTQNSNNDNKNNQGMNLKETVEMLKKQLHYVRTDFKKIWDQNNKMQKYVAAKNNQFTTDNSAGQNKSINSHDGYLSRRSDVADISKRIFSKYPQNNQHQLEYNSQRTPSQYQGNDYHPHINNTRFRKQAHQVPQRSIISYENKNEQNEEEQNYIYNNEVKQYKQVHKVSAEQKWKKWSNLQTRISQLQQQNRELKKTLHS